jgi:hypothetical protein
VTPHQAQTLRSSTTVSVNRREDGAYSRRFVMITDVSV